jgi:hypothetical protein
MNRRTTWIAGGALTVAVVGGGAGIAIASGGDDDAPLSGSALEQASTAALAETGGGTVTEAEVGDGRAAYSVEVRLADGSHVEVNLDATFHVIGSSADDDGSGADEGSGADDGSGHDDGPED